MKNEKDEREKMPIGPGGIRPKSEKTHVDDERRGYVVKHLWCQAFVASLMKPCNAYTDATRDANHAVDAFNARFRGEV